MLLISSLGFLLKNEDFLIIFILTTEYVIMEYQAEFELNTNEKLIFEYLSTPGGLQQWMAEDVRVLDSDQLIFVMDGDEYKIEVSSKKLNKHIVFEFVDLEGDDEETPRLEFQLEMNDLTRTLYLIVKDASTLVDSQEECYEIWETLVNDLKEIVGA